MWLWVRSDAFVKGHAHSGSLPKGSVFTVERVGGAMRWSKTPVVMIRGGAAWWSG
jgi:hypothetical protein